REDGCDSGTEHLAVHLVREVLVGRTGEDLAAAAPQRAVRLTGARSPGAFLRPRLLVRLIDLAASLLRTRAAARVGLVSDHDLVDQRLVVLAAEQRVGRRQSGGRVARLVGGVSIPVWRPSLPGPSLPARRRSGPPP